MGNKFLEQIFQSRETKFCHISCLVTVQISHIHCLSVPMGTCRTSATWEHSHHTLLAGLYSNSEFLGTTTSWRVFCPILVPSPLLKQQESGYFVLPLLCQPWTDDLMIILILCHLGLFMDKTVINLQCHYCCIITDVSLWELPGNIRKCYGPCAVQYQHLFDVFFKHCLVSGTMVMGFSSLRFRIGTIVFKRQKRFTNSC